jgi:MoxR-like ATPase
MSMFESVDDAMKALARQRYAADRDTATAVYLAFELGKPLFVEGAHGTGKSSLGNAIAAALDAPLVRLRCYAGMDPERAAFSWDYGGQLLRMAQATGEATSQASRLPRLRTQEFVLPGPLLKALSGQANPVVLLVDDVNRAGPGFESYLADYLESFALEIPGSGVVRATRPPRVVVTSSAGTPPSLSAAVQYLWLDYPVYEREVAIVHGHVPGISASLAGEVCNVVSAVRLGRFQRKPGIGETIDWARALVALHRTALDDDTVNETLGCVMKHPADIARFRKEHFYEQIAEQRLDVAG